MMFENYHEKDFLVGFSKGGKLLFYYLHRDGFFVFGPMELKIGGVTLLRVLNQWF